MSQPLTSQLHSESLRIRFTPFLSAERFGVAPGGKGLARGMGNQHINIVEVY